MTRLFAAELARLRARRAIWIFVVAAIALLGAFQIAVNSLVSPPSVADRARIEQSYQEAHKEWADQHVQQEADCRAQGGSDQDCSQPEPSRSDYGLDPASYAEVASESLQIGTAVSWFALFLIGATAIGAEFTTGAIGNWLTFVPRRGRVLASKLLALGLTGVLIGALLAVLALAVPALLVAVHGGDVTLPARLVWQALRGIAIGLVVSAIGFGVALITRHTVGAIGLGMGYLVALFVRTTLLSSVSWAQRLTPWTPEGNFIAVLSAGYEYQVPVTVRDPSGLQSMDLVARTVTWEHGAIYSVALLALVVVVSAVVFSRRDVN